MIRRWSSTLARLPAVLHLPTGREAWPGPVLADDTALWWRAGDDIWSIDGDFSAVHRIDGALAAWTTDGRGCVLRDGLAATAGRSTNRGEVTRDAAGWNVPWDADLPEGARRATALWPAPDGGAVLWYDHENGFLYRKDAEIRALATLADVPVIAAGPRGSAVVDGRLALAPGCGMVPLERQLAPDRWIRFSDDGRSAAGATEDGDTAIVDLATGRITRAEPGLPVDMKSRFHPDSGAIDAEPLGLVDATPALSGDILAGPGGALWDLASGRRTSPFATIALGASTAFDGGFLTVRWDTGLARLVDVDGSTRWTCQVPFEDGDVVARAEADVVVLASGAAFRAGPSGARSVPAPRGERASRGEDGPIRVEGTARIGGRSWGWRSDGLLIAW